MQRLFTWFNYLYTGCFPLYRLIYFLYKRWSDRDKIRLIKNHVRKGMSVLDIGANIGFYTSLLSDLVGESGMVYAFEPDENNYRRLTQTTRGRKNVLTIQSACGEKKGTLYLYQSPDMNVDHQTYDSGESRHKIEVRVLSIDDFLKDKNQHPGFIKIDVQGYDCFAFHGMIKTVANAPDVLLIGELWPYGLKKAGADTDTYLNLIRRAGFEIRLFSHHTTDDLSRFEEDKFFYIDFWAVKKG
jgi:FkbM family methyltransferase